MKSLGVLALAACIACGGKVDEGRKDTATECPAATSPGGEVGIGPIDALNSAAKTFGDAMDRARSDIDGAVAALASIFQVVPRISGGNATMEDVVDTIAGHLAASTVSGFEIPLGDATCYANDSVAEATRSECESAEAGSDDLCAEMGRLNGLASATCTVSQVIVSYTLSPNATPEQRDEFVGRASAFGEQAKIILDAHATLSALVDGKVNDVAVFDSAPLADIKNAYKTMVNSDSLSLSGIPAACLSYAIPPITSHLALLNGSVTESARALSDGTRFRDLF